MNFVSNSIVLRKVFKENRRSASSQVAADVCSTVCVKSILGISPKVNESIEDPFK
jgi:hypothetical protein